MGAIDQRLTKYAKEWSPLQSWRRFASGYLPLGESRFMELWKPHNDHMRFGPRQLAKTTSLA